MVPTYTVHCTCSCGAAARLEDVPLPELDTRTGTWITDHVLAGHTPETLAQPVPWEARVLLAIEEALVRRGRAGLVL